MRRPAGTPRNPYATAEINMASDYTADELEFLAAIQEHQKRYKRRFPSFTEVLHVARSLGYRKVPVAVPTLQEETT